MKEEPKLASNNQEKQLLKNIFKKIKTKFISN